MNSKILLLIFLLFAMASAHAQPGGWNVNASAFQYSMTMVVQIQVNGVPDNLLNNHLAVFSKGQLRGYAAPVRFNGQAYYFLNNYASAYKGDTLYFRVYRGADQKVYESVDTVIFKHHLAMGKLAGPIPIRLILGNKPLIYSLQDVNYTENTCPDVVDVQASDNENSEGNGLIYSITGGVDAARFSIHPQTGVLSWFNFTPDADMPADADGDNRYEVEVKATDASNLFSLQRVTVTVVKNAPLPALVCPGNQMLVTADDGTGNCGAEAATTAVALPNVCAAYDLSYQLTGATAATGTGTVPANQQFATGVTTVAYTRGSSQCTFTVTVADNEKPTITCPANLTLECSAAPGYYPSLINAWIATAGVTDNCGANITTGYGTASPTLNCNLITGLTVVFTATDAAQNTAKCTRTVLVDDTQKPLFTAVPASVTVECNGIPVVGTPSASDNCDQSLSVQYNGQTRINGPCTDTYTLSRKWTATDDCGNSQTAIQLITVQDTQKPNFTAVPANVTVQCNAVPPVGNPAATDKCDSQVLIAYNGETRSQGACPDTYVLTRKWTAVDNCNNTKTATQKITVRDTQRPNFTAVPAHVTVACNSVPNAGTPVATDNCDASVTITYLGQTIKTGACPDSYAITRSWRATDNCGNSTTTSQLITVRDTQKPVFTSIPQNLTLQCSASLPAVGAPVATDNCDAMVAITYLGQNTANANCQNSYQLLRTWRATDNCGNSSIVTQTITMQDTQAPVFTSVPDNITIQCSQLVPPIGSPTATDACGGYVQIVFLGQTSVAGSCPYNYVITRTWRAQDLCGNATTAGHTITVQDTQAPNFTNAPANASITCGAALPNLPVVTATDNCDNIVPVTYLGETNTGPDCPFTVTRTWMVNDDCGNARTHTQVITVGSQYFGNRVFEVSGLKLEDPPMNVDFRTPTANRQWPTAKLFPNPAKNEVWVTFEVDLEHEATLFLFDAGGRLVRLQELDVAGLPNWCRVDLNGVPSGLYFVQIKTPGQAAQTLKLIVK